MDPGLGWQLSAGIFTESLPSQLSTGVDSSDGCGTSGQEWTGKDAIDTISIVMISKYFLRFELWHCWASWMFLSAMLRLSWRWSGLQGVSRYSLRRKHRWRGICMPGDAVLQNSNSCADGDQSLLVRGAALRRNSI